jgi:hypothetical protein
MCTKSERRALNLNNRVGRDKGARSVKDTCHVDNPLNPKFEGSNVFKLLCRSSLHDALSLVPLGFLKRRWLCLALKASVWNLLRVVACLKLFPPLSSLYPLASGDVLWLTILLLEGYETSGLIPTQNLDHIYPRQGV